jgi:hypothetical protein
MVTRAGEPSGRRILRASMLGGIERRLQECLYFVLRQDGSTKQGPVRASDRRIARCVRCIDEHERVTSAVFVEVGSTNSPTQAGQTWCPRGSRRRIARHGYQCADRVRIDANAGADAGIAAQLIEVHIAEAERLAIRGDPVAASIDGRGES